MSGVSAPMILGFADRRDASGRYPVSDETGSVVASIEKLFARNQFVAYDGAGGLLGQGGLRVLGPWQAVDAAGNLLVKISRGAFGQHSVVLGDGWRGSLRGRLFSRDWRVEDGAGAVAISAVPHRAGWIFAPDDWLVQSTLGLPETVALVELHRLDLKRKRRQSAG